MGGMLSAAQDPVWRNVPTTVDGGMLSAARIVGKVYPSQRASGAGGMLSAEQGVE